MTDFVLSKDSTLIYKYANLLKQPLELCMFVPCSEDGNVLEHPNYIKGERTSQFYNDKMDEYKQAKDRCLFDRFEFTETHMKGIDSNLNLFVFPYGNNRFGLTKKQEAFRTWFQLFNIEDLVQCDLQLTPTAQKQIGL